MADVTCVEFFTAITKNKKAYFPFLRLGTPKVALKELVSPKIDRYHRISRGWVGISTAQLRNTLCLVP